VIKIEIPDNQAIQLKRMIEESATTIRKRKYPPQGLTIDESYTRLELAGTAVPQIEQQIGRTLHPSEVG